MICPLTITCCLHQWSAVKGCYGPGLERPSFHRLLALHYSAFSKQELRFYLNISTRMYPCWVFHSFWSCLVFKKSLNQGWKQECRCSSTFPECRLLQEVTGTISMQAHNTVFTMQRQLKGWMQRFDFQPMHSSVTCTLSIVIPLSWSTLYFNQFTQRLSR